MLKHYSDPVKISSCSTPECYPNGTGGIISNTPFVPHLSTPSTGMRTRELHGRQGYAKQVRVMYGREDVDPPGQDPPTFGLSSRGSRSQASHSAGLQGRPGQSVPAFPGSRIVPIRRIDSRDTSYQRILKFGTSKVPRFTKVTLVNTEVHHLIQYIHQYYAMKLSMTQCWAILSTMI
jgi:hypothetical protein